MVFAAFPVIIPMATTSAARPQGDGVRVGGAVLGILVFLAGVALVGYVFTSARVLFDEPPPTLPLPTPPATTGTGAGQAANTAASTAATGAALALGQSFTQFLQRLLALLLMCVAGSAIGALGIHLFGRAFTSAPPRTP